MAEVETSSDGPSQSDELDSIPTALTDDQQHAPAEQNQPAPSERRSYHMPTEILLRIFHYAIGGPGCRVKWQHAATDEYRFHYPHTQSTPNEIAQTTCTLCPLLNLYNWALVNRQWNAVVTPYLYTEIDIHTLAIPAHVVARPLLFRRDIWPFGTATEQVATSVTCLVAEPTTSERIGQVLPVPKYGRYARLQTRPFQKRRDQGLLTLGSMAQWQKGNRIEPTEDQEYLVTFEYAPGEFEIEMENEDIDRESDFIEYKTKRAFEYAPIRTPQDCCFPKHHHHNFTPEWWDLLRIWEDPTEQNPITQYVLDRVLKPLLRTLTERPDLAALVKKIQLPLVVYQDYVIMSSTADDSTTKKRPLTLVGTDVTKPEEQRLRLREAIRTGSKGPGVPTVLVELLQSTLNLTQLCQQLESLDGYWSMDIASLHQNRIRVQKQMMEVPVLTQDLQQQNSSQLDTAPSEQQTGKSPRKQANRISRLFTRVINRKSSRNKLVENDAQQSGSNPDGLSSDGSDHSRSVSDASSGSSRSEPQATELAAAHFSLQDAMANSRSKPILPTPSALWTDILTSSMQKLKYLKLEFASPMSMALPDCSWLSHCGSNPENKLCGKRYWHRYLDPVNLTILTDLLSRDQQQSFHSWPLETLENLVHLDFSTIEEDEIHENGTVFNKLKSRFGKALESGLHNLRKLSVMDSYITLLTVLPNNKLESLQVSRWHTNTIHIALVLEYLARSYDSVEQKNDTRLKHLTIDTVSVKLGTAYWDGVECYPLLIGGVSTCMVTLPCGAERRIFNCGDIHEQYFLNLEAVYSIIRHAPNLQELVLRRGRLALDEYWKMQMEALYMDWDVQLHCQELSPPIAANLTSLALLTWGNGPRTWLSHALKHDQMFPNLQYLTYAPAEGEHRRRERFKAWYRGGPSSKERCRDFRFSNWDAVEDAALGRVSSSLSNGKNQLNEAEAREVDACITGWLSERGVKVTMDRIMENWGMSLPRYRSTVITGGQKQRGPIPVDNVDSKRLWGWYYGQIRDWWLRSCNNPVVERDY